MKNIIKNTEVVFNGKNLLIEYYSEKTKRDGPVCQRCIFFQATTCEGIGTCQQFNDADVGAKEKTSGRTFNCNNIYLPTTNDEGSYVYLEVSVIEPTKPVHKKPENHQTEEELKLCSMLL